MLLGICGFLSLSLMVVGFIAYSRRFYTYAYGRANAQMRFRRAVYTVRVRKSPRAPMGFQFGDFGEDTVVFNTLSCSVRHISTFNADDAIIIIVFQHHAVLPNCFTTCHHCSNIAERHKQQAMFFDAVDVSSVGTVSGEQFERADRDYRPLQFGKRESYRPLQFGKRIVASRGLLFAPAVAPPAFMHNLLHNSGLEEMDPTMDQYVLMVEERRK
uniref:Uncharacterized protein n=1 Tax=Globodera pallida TaxID=36090 RepID=A0A183CF82_GLOPA